MILDDERALQIALDVYDKHDGFPDDATNIEIDNLIDQVVALNREGLSDKEIAVVLGRTPGSISYIRRRNGIPGIPNRGAKFGGRW